MLTCFAIGDLADVDGDPELTGYGRNPGAYYRVSLALSRISTLELTPSNRTRNGLGQDVLPG
jgi:hypothetical protein